MRIAVINEVSASDKNADIIEALKPFQHEVINLGMKNGSDVPELTYIHTGLLAALLLHTKRVDYVVGGCGTGQGFLISIMQYPGVICGLINTPLDAWLFTQINGGNCISLRLNQGYGWASNENLKFIFEKLFSVESGCGYPDYRKESQQQSLKTLKMVSEKSHCRFEEILQKLPPEIVRTAIGYPGVLETLDVGTLEDTNLVDIIKKIIQ